MRRVLLFCLILVLLPVPFPAQAGDTHACADCEQATVAQAITDAKDGDTITIPADSCEWSSGVTVPDDEQWEDNPAGIFKQSKAPAYIWNNVNGSGAAIGVYVVNNSEGHIQAGRDYFLTQHPTYTCYDCPHPLTGYTGSCSSSIAGVGGYNLSSGITGIGSGGSATIGGSGT